MISNAASSIEKSTSVPQITQIKQIVRAISDQEIFYFPIRHHSPICAYHVKQAIQEEKPQIIFLELPANHKELLSYIVDEQTQPPIALYSSLNDKDNEFGANGILTPKQTIPAKFQSWFPLTTYSPEYQVLLQAHKSDIPVVFFDLPYYIQLRYLLDLKQETVEKARNLDYLWISSDFIRSFVANSDFSNFDEVWDSLFEVQGLEQPTSEFIANFLIFAASARAMIPPHIFSKDATVIREEFMRWTIEQKLKEYNIDRKDAMVVAGAFHCVTLPFLSPKENDLFSDKKFDVMNSIVPFSYFSVSDFSGYGAGNSAPYYYGKIWNKLKRSKKPYQKEALNIISRTIKHVRSSGEIMSSADIIATYQTSILLARLRKRNQPILTDIKDALITCCVKGRNDFEGQSILNSFRKYVIGHTIGKVTPNLGTTPLTHDFYGMMDLLGLSKTKEVKTYRFSLLKPDPKEMVLSAFFHKCLFLDIPIVQCINTQELTVQTEIYREEWNLSWSPAVDTRLLELNMYGPTLDLAVTGMYKEKMEIHKNKPHEIVLLLFKLLQFRKVSLIDTTINVLGSGVATSTSFVSLGKTFNYLIMFFNYTMNRETFSKKVDNIVDLIIETFSRCCFELPNIVTGETEAIHEIVDILYSLIDNAISASLDLDFDLLIQMSNATILQARNHTIKGALVGVLSKINAITAAEIQTYIVNYSKSREKDAKFIGDFLFGLLRVSKSLLLDEKIFTAINVVIMAPNSNNFVKILPNLKKCFAELSELEKRGLKDRVLSIGKENRSNNDPFMHMGNISRTFLETIETKVFDILDRWGI